MSLDHGGQFTYGASVSFSGKAYNAIIYGLNGGTCEIDMSQVESLTIEHRPKMIVAGFSVYSGIVYWLKLRQFLTK